ncbi:guanine deaminase [Proteiniborus sp. MB09-C3]|uniref:guanine deaminase n=1 Tax=Proteiniborus sp. MB09-C3 TaxID=3050072 RepID=UPI002557AF45|nr:guanine deaminase [Proteiniborus sp. MB09-C3]WIV13098.1 guanine deaminase [Proteiniborus sp. MB09-C3]
MNQKLKEDSIKIYKGHVIFTESPERFNTVENGFIIVENNIVKKVVSKIPDEYKNISVKDFGNRIIIPGFVDLHLHAPQFPNAGLGLDKELLPWLEEYTFPEEAKYKDTGYAKKVYSRVVEELWKNGTTRAVIFASVHKEATALLFDLLVKAGLGAYVGKVNMDRNCPDIIIEDTQQSLKDTREYLETHVNKSEHVKPIITPRFVPTCSAGILEELGKMANEFDVPIQSHLSENMGEVEWVKELHPEHGNYADVYDCYSLFGQKPTIMAHCIYNTEEEVILMRNNEVYAAHCPYSNLNLSSGIMPVRHFLDKGVNVGLGSDISGGHKMSIPSVMAIAAQISKIKWLETNKELAPLTTSEVFYLGTKGGGKFFGKVGSFEEGYEFDALVIDDSSFLGDNLTLEERLQRFIYLGDDRNIVERYVAGNRIEKPSF